MGFEVGDKWGDPPSGADFLGIVLKKEKCLELPKMGRTLIRICLIFLYYVLLGICTTLTSSTHIPGAHVSHCVHFTGNYSIN